MKNINMSSSDSKIGDSSSVKEFELLDFQHKRIYDRYLIGVELTKSLRGTERFRLTVLSVIATIGISVFLSTFILGGNNDIPNFSQFYLVIIVIFMIDLSCLFIPVISAYHNSDKFSEDVISKDRGIIIDEVGTPDKQTIQKNDIEMWMRRIWQTGGHVKKTSKGFRETQTAFSLFTLVSILALFEIILANLFTSEYVMWSQIALILSACLLSIPALLLLYPWITKVLNRIRRIKAPFLTATVSSIITPGCVTSISGTSTSQYPYLDQWLCTMDTLIDYRAIKVNNDHTYQYTIPTEITDTLIPGTLYFCILQMSKTSKKGRISLIRSDNKYEIVEILKNGKIDPLSTIYLTREGKSTALPLKITRLIDDTDTETYVKLMLLCKGSDDVTGF
jgi:hypothetical protein